MPDQTRVVTPTFPYDQVRLEDGTKRKVPEGWVLLPPGDALVTRRVKAAGPHWVVQEKVGRRMMSRGVWAPAETVEREKARAEQERADPAWARRQQQAAVRREEKQAVYVEDFRGAVLAFLAFHERYRDLAEHLADAVTAHATPVGSGTVARTERIPIEERAESAVIAWMRHQTTGYDQMKIPLVKGRRREVRRMLAQRSRELLAEYRRGEPLSAGCPLRKALRPGG